MLDLFSKIAGALSSGISYLVHSITTFVNLLSHIPSYVSFLVRVVGAVLPSVFIPFAVASISISVIYLIVGRNG